MINRLVEIFQYREMLKNLILSNLRTRYKGSLLGFLWTFVNPLLMLCVYTVLFSTIMRIQMDNYVMFLFVGLLAWIMFQSSILDSASVIINNANLVKKIYFPREVLPISQVLASVVNYLFSFVILGISLTVSGIYLNFNVIYLPFVLIVQTTLALGISFIVSSLNVYFRDLQHILNILLMAWFYFTPVLYPSSMIPEKYKLLFLLNPMAHIIEGYQDILFKGIKPNLEVLSVVFLISMLVVILGWLLFNYLNKGFAEEV